jgi:hypothetical protein
MKSTVLPGSGDGPTVEAITHEGLHLEWIDPDNRSDVTCLKGYRDPIGEKSNGLPHGMPKAIANCLCDAACRMKSRPYQCQFTAAEAACRLTSGDLLALTSGDAGSETREALSEQSLAASLMHAAAPRQGSKKLVIRL